MLLFAKCKLFSKIAFTQMIPKYNFANFALVAGKYVVPQKPSSTVIKSMIMADIKKQQNVNEEEMRIIYDKLTPTELEAYKQKLAADADAKRQELEEWHKKYDKPKKLLRLDAFRLHYIRHNLPEGKIKPGEKSTDYIRRLAQINKQKDDFFKQHESMLLEKISVINKERQARRDEYEELYSLPLIYSRYHLFLKKNKLSLVESTKQYNLLTAEQKLALDKEADELNKQAEQKLSEFASRYGLSLEEFKKELRIKQKKSKLIKKAKADKSSSSSSSSDDEKAKKEKKEK